MSRRQPGNLPRPELHLRPPRRAPWTGRSAGCLLALLLAGWTSSATAQGAAPEPVDDAWRATATDVERLGDHPFDAPYCDHPLLVSDLLKDLGHSVEREAVALTAVGVVDEEERALAPFVLDYARGVLPDAGDEATRAYLEALLAQVTPFSTRQLDWQVHIYESPDANAYALPGGLFYVSTALIDVVTNEAQMVAVLAHELGHHELRHATAHIQYLKLLGVWTPDDGLNSTSSTALAAFALPFQSRQEQAADAFAVNVLMQLGYSPHQAAQLMLVFDFLFSPPDTETHGSFAGFVLTEARNLLDDHPPARLRACAIKQAIALRADADSDLPFYVGRQNWVSRTPRAITSF